MATRRKKTITTSSGLKLNCVHGLYLPVLRPGTPKLATEKLIELAHRIEEEEDLRKCGLLRPIRKSRF